MSKLKEILDYPKQVEMSKKQLVINRVRSLLTWRVVMFLSILLVVMNIYFFLEQGDSTERAREAFVLALVEIFALPLVCSLVAGPCYFIFFGNKETVTLSWIALWLYFVVNFLGLIWQIFNYL